MKIRCPKLFCLKTMRIHLKKKKKLCRIKTLLKSCYLTFGGPLISINLHLLFSDCFNLILLKILFKNFLGINSAIQDRVPPMKILILMGTRYIRESPTKRPANYQVMMGMNNCLLSPKTTPWCLKLFCIQIAK